MPPPLIGGGIKRCFCLTVYMSRTSGLSREQIKKNSVEGPAPSPSGEGAPPSHIPPPRCLDPRACGASSSPHLCSCKLTLKNPERTIRRSVFSLFPCDVGSCQVFLECSVPCLLWTASSSPAIVDVQRRHGAEHSRKTWRFGSWQNLDSVSVRCCWVRILSHLCDIRVATSELEHSVINWVN